MAYARFTEDDGKRIARAVIAVKRQQHRRLPVRNLPIFNRGQATPTTWVLLQSKEAEAGVYSGQLCEFAVTPPFAWSAVGEEITIVNLQDKIFYGVGGNPSHSLGVNDSFPYRADYWGAPGLYSSSSSGASIWDRPVYLISEYGLCY